MVRLTDMRPEETKVGVVWVELCVGISVMRAMPSAPPFYRALDCACASHGQEVLERFRGVVRAMSP